MSNGELRLGNFGRVVRRALSYYGTVVGAVLCALIVAVLWGGNIGALYPIIQVVGANQSLDQWVADQIHQAEQNSNTLHAEIARLDSGVAAAAAADRQRLENERSTVEVQLEAEQDALAHYQWLQGPIDRYLPNDPYRTLLVIVVLLMVSTVIKDTFLTLGSILVDRLGHLATFDLRKEFFRRTLRMDLATFSENGTSDLLSRFTYDMDSVAGGVQTLFGRAVREPLKMISCLVFAALISWRLLILCMVVAPVAGFLIAHLAKTLKRANRRAMEEMSYLYNALVETFGGIKVVKAFTMERQERRRFHSIGKKFYRKSMRIAVFDAMINPVTEVMGIATICLAILAGAYLVLNHETHLFGIRMSNRPLTLPGLMVFYGMLAGISDPARRMTETFNRIQRAVAASDRIYQLLDREPTIRNPARPRPLVRHHRELAFEGVSFSYQPQQSVLENIDLRIAFGETIAIVGPNGCGKSTLANLIPRFFDPVSGTVRLDGVDLRDVRLRDLRRQIGLVTQETLLFDDTVYNNIRYGAPRATRDEVIEAAKQAHAHRFIESRLEKGYDTLVGAQGGRLSGGQRQRIALARAILRDPSILILDEATSQIDLESEQLIHKVLELFIRNRTTVMITHRLATLALANRIVVMQSGRILDLGTHEQLAARCDAYRRLHQLQFKETA